MAFRPTAPPPEGPESAVPVSGFLPFDPYAYGWDGEDNDRPRRHITLSGLHRTAAAWAKDVTGKAIGYHAAAAQALDAWDRAHNLDTADARMAEIKARFLATTDDDDEDGYPRTNAPPPLRCPSFPRSHRLHPARLPPTSTRSRNSFTPPMTPRFCWPTT
jgi:hypothetical protein